MIKINLMPHLPRAQRRKRANLGMQLAIGVGVVFLTLTMCWVWGSSLLQQRDLLRQEKISKEHVLATIVAKNQEDEKLKEKQDLLMAHAHFLTGHDEQKYLPILALDQISKSIEPLKVWLIALSIDQHDVSIEGKALSREDVGQFIGNLEASSMFGQFIRMETQPHHIQGEVLHQFTLQFTAQS